MRWQKQWCDGEDEDEEEEQNCDHKHCTRSHWVCFFLLQFLCRHLLSQLVHSMSKSESNYENAIERPLLPLWLLIENLWPVRSSDVQSPDRLIEKALVQILLKKLSWKCVHGNGNDMGKSINQSIKILLKKMNWKCVENAIRDQSKIKNQSK